MRFKYISDPGHGWLEVPVSELKRLGIVDSITLYSYISDDGKTAYLEEDSDAGKFSRAYEAEGHKFEYYEQVVSYGQAFCRNLPPFKKERVLCIE